MKSEKEIIEVIAQCLAMVPVQLSMAPVKDDCLRELAAEIAPQLNRSMLLSMFNQKHNPDEYTLTSNVKQELDHLVLNMKDWMVPTTQFEVNLDPVPEMECEPVTFSIRSLPRRANPNFDGDAVNPPPFGILGSPCEGMVSTLLEDMKRIGHSRAALQSVKHVDPTLHERLKGLLAVGEVGYRLKDEYVFPTDRIPTTSYIKVTNLQKCMVLPIEVGTPHITEHTLTVPRFIYDQLNNFLEESSIEFVAWLVADRKIPAREVDEMLTNRKVHAYHLHILMNQFKTNQETDTRPNTENMRRASLRGKFILKAKHLLNLYNKKLTDFLTGQVGLSHDEVIDLFDNVEENAFVILRYFDAYNKHLESN